MQFCLAGVRPPSSGPGPDMNSLNAPKLQKEIGPTDLAHKPQHGDPSMASQLPPTDQSKFNSFYTN